MAADKAKPRVIIVGAGLSAIILAIRIKKELKLESFTLYERAEEEAGTWRDNTYPGCACDVPSHWYSLSTELNPDWSRKFSGQAEIKRYWKYIFAKNGLGSHAVFNRTFKNAKWNDELSLWDVTLYNTKNPDEVFHDQAEFLVSAAGGLSNPSFQKNSLKGLEDFEGEAFHTAQYDHSVSLANKKVAVIGNGCSAAQLIPEISKDASVNLTNFMRTASWFAPRGNYEYSKTTKWIFRHVPFVMRAYRTWLVATGDLRWLAWTKPFGTFLRKAAEKQMLARMRSIAPPAYHQLLTPNYELGCKRIIMDPGYYESLNRENVTLLSTGIDTFTKKGIRTVDGTEHSFSTIIFATGFDTSTTSVGLDIEARGRKLLDVWEEKKGPQAYLGTSVASFPNFAFLLGPNVASGHYSVIGSSEMQISMVLGLIKPLIKQGVKSLEVKEEVENAFNDEIQGRLGKTVFAGCSSWYRIAGSGKISSVRPGFYFEFWYRTRMVDYGKYIQKGGRPLGSSSGLLSKFALLLAGLAAFSAWRLGHI